MDQLLCLRGHNAFGCFDLRLAECLRVIDFFNPVPHWLQTIMHHVLYNTLYLMKLEVLLKFVQVIQVFILKNFHDPPVFFFQIKNNV